MSKKQILIINTGGTICSVKTKQGYMPREGYLAKSLARMDELRHDDMPDYTLIECDPLLDSSNIDTTHWCQLVDMVKCYYADYDGFVLLHGTDTMAYTASALSFMCEHLAKPIIITGSQLPLSEIRNDAKENIVTALWLAQFDKLNEVFIYFNQQLLRGNRTQKVSSSQFNAFASPNFQPIASCGTYVTWNDPLLLPKPTKSFQAYHMQAAPVASFRLCPGSETALLQHFLDYPLEGLILETYGSGNAKTDKVFLDMLSKASEDGVIIINRTQCHHGHVNMDTYATGKTLALAGLVNAGDMTPEAAYTKLLFLLHNQTQMSEIKKLFEIPLRGEKS